MDDPKLSHVYYNHVFVSNEDDLPEHRFELKKTNITTGYVRPKWEFHTLTSADIIIFHITRPQWLKAS